ncbi:neprilysin-1 [Caerostris darwini]|uniref:Neprilysin-1 n=1 Tax=Caerostris darwini TaxID=1538125 RepID=A0AAV4S3W4_9ARAC|nr:neprilysin-1 [Caerostris darwini]
MQNGQIQSGSLNGNSNAFLISANEHKKRARSAIFRAPKSLQEKLLILVVCFLLVITTVFLITLWIMSNRWKATLSQLKNVYVEEDDLCDTDACRETAEGLISNIDPSTDPCVDFYQYACGGWMDKHPIPEGRRVYMVHQERQKEVLDIIKDLVTQESNDTVNSRAINNTRSFFLACVNKDVRNERGIKPLQDLLKKHGGWPMLGNGEWSESDFDWQKLSANVNRELFLDIFADISFSNKLDDNKHYMILLKSGYFLFENEEFGHDFLDQNASESAHDFILDIARAMGSTLADEDLLAQAEEIVSLEFELYNYSKEIIDDDEDIEVTVGDLNVNTDGIIFSYIDFFNYHLQSDVPIENNTYMYVFQTRYFKMLPNILKKVKKRTIANYIAFNIVFHFAGYTSDDMRTVIRGNDSSTTISEEQLCLRITKAFMHVTVGRMYIDRYFPPLTRMHVKKMVEMISLAYSSTIDQNTWMDENTLLYALVKLQSIQSMVGHEEWILNDELLDAYYAKLGDADADNYFEAVVILGGILNDEKYSKWNKTARRNETDSSTSNPLVVNAYYVPKINFISLPAGMLGYPYYKYGRIDSINYGAIGTVIGHEISHAFDTTGRSFDHLGNLRDWWTNGTKMKFLDKAECFVHQYNDYKDPFSDVKVDGLVTVGENIADNGGVRNAFKAFRLHLALSGENLNYRKRLPGLSASPEQLFFLGYASIWCANMTEEYAMGFTENDEHCPNKIRVNVPLANFKEFAKAYQCKPGTPMNPLEKCILW